VYVCLDGSCPQCRSTTMTSLPSSSALIFSSRNRRPSHPACSPGSHTP
jgi:hypothetical protein